MSEEEK